MASIVKKMEKLEVETSKLTPCPKNPNKHPQAQIEALMKSVERYGQYLPIVVDENFMILRGHGTHEALSKLGMEKSYVTQLFGLTEAQKLKVVAEDNQIQGMSSINYNELEDLLRSIGDTDIIGFDDTYLDAIINDSAFDNAGVDFSEPDPTPAQMQTGTGSGAPSYSPAEEQKQEEVVLNIEEGMQKARTIKCPHCGKEITL